MRVGILGSGLMGAKLGTIFARAGHEVIFTYARSKEKLKQLARDAKGKASAATPSEAAVKADALLLAVHWSQIVDRVLRWHTAHERLICPRVRTRRLEQLLRHRWLVCRRVDRIAVRRHGPYFRDAERPR